MELLKVDKLVKSFGGLKAIQGVNFTVEKGQIASIIGPNGAGKTTLFNMLTGFYTPDSGNIQLDGNDLVGLKTHEFIQKGIARTFQNIRLFAGLTVLENVLIGLQQNIHYGLFSAVFRSGKRKVEEQKSIDMAMEFLAKFDLINKKDEMAQNLPYGQQKKLEIARAIASSPKLVLLDEPAAGLNAQETAELNRMIRHLPREGITVVLIEHDMRLVMDISDNIIVLDHGVKIAEGKAHDIQINPQVVEAYLGKGREQYAGS